MKKKQIRKYCLQAAYKDGIISVRAIHSRKGEITK